MTKSILTGLVAAPFTAFQADASLDLAAIPRQAALLAHNGVSGAFVCGTTGEGQSLTIEERKQVVEAWRQAAPPSLRLVVHVGHLSLADSCTLAPSFFKPPGVAELVSWCAKVAAAAPRLPFYYYHMPAMTGVAIPAAEFLQHTNGQIPTLAGIKFTHEDLMDYGRASEIGSGRIDMLFGRDEILLAGLSLGAAGAVGSTYNFAAPLFLRIMKSFASGNIEAARIDQTRAREFISVLHRHGGLAAGKATMKLVGVDCGDVRLPLRSLSAEQVASLQRGLEDIGFFDYCSREP
jgi:N-acetylneuraminate lyase